MAALLALWAVPKKNSRGTGRNKNNTAADEKKNNLTPEQIAQLDADLAAIVREAARMPVPESSLDKIRTAYYDGKINEENAVLLAVEALYTPEELPDGYRTTASAHPVEINAELQWIGDNLASMSQEMRRKLEPFVLPSDNPGSYYYQAQGGKAQNDTVQNNTMQNNTVQDTADISQQKSAGTFLGLFEPALALAAPENSPIVVNTINIDGAARIFGMIQPRLPHKIRKCRKRP